MMQKDIYQSYDFISNELANSNQYFLVEDNKAFLINKITNRATGEVQYVTENVKEHLESLQAQPCPGYDVSQEQYYINDGELIVTDALNIPSGQTSNVISDSILIQAVPKTSTNEVQQQVLPEQQITESDVPLEGPVAPEITLSYEQCKILEEKGWLLLEASDNVYVLNTSGLHNITNDKELIQKCRTIISENEANNVTTHQEFAEVKEEIHYAKEEHVAEETIVQTTEESIPMNIEIENITMLKTIKGSMAGSTSEIDRNLIQYDLPATSVDNNMMMVATDEPVFKMETQDALGGIEEMYIDVNQDNEPIIDEVGQVSIDMEKRKLPITNNKSYTATKKVVKLKLQSHLKDIPKQIFLCVLKNGKKLCARRKMPLKTEMLYNTPLTMVVGEGLNKKKQKKRNNTKSGQEQFRDEVETAMNNACSLSQWTCTDEDLGAAETIITQLLNMGHIEGMMTGKNIILTKVQKKETRVGDLIEMKSELKSVVTGRIAQFDDSVNNWKFIYVPSLIEKLMKMDKDCDEYEMSVTGDPLPRQRDKCLEEDCIHIHVSETVGDNMAPQTILTLSKRHLPWQPNNLKKSVLACSACASIFDTLPELIKHQNEVCNREKDPLENEEGTLQIDTNEGAKSPVYLMWTNGDTMYKCKHCQSSFKKIANYQRHKKSHGIMNEENGLQKSHSEQNTSKQFKKSQNDQPEPLYKCNMCAALYNRSPTLIRHILSKHISKSILKQS